MDTHRTFSRVIPLDNIIQERFIIGVDPPFEKDGLEEILETILGEDFFEKNKFSLFLATIIIVICLLISCCCFCARKTFRKCPSNERRKRFRQISIQSDKMLESGLPQETFQFMPLKALSPLDITSSYRDQDLPDYEVLQMKRIEPSRLNNLNNLYS